MSSILQGKQGGRRTRNFGPPRANTQPPSPKIVVSDDLEDENYKSCLPENEEVEPIWGLVIPPPLTTRSEAKPRDYSLKSLRPQKPVDAPKIVVTPRVLRLRAMSQ